MKDGGGIDGLPFYLQSDHCNHDCDCMHGPRERQTDRRKEGRVGRRDEGKQGGCERVVGVTPSPCITYIHDAKIKIIIKERSSMGWSG